MALAADAPGPAKSSAGHLREIVRHGGVFGIGVVLTRMTSIVLLPFYTSVLTQADYGVIAILDMTQDLLKLSIGTAWTSAIGRFHFERDDADAQSRAWWTALTALAMLSTVALMPLFGTAVQLGETMLGDVPQGGYLVSLMLAGMWFSLPEAMLQNHLRVIKRSNLAVGLGLGRFFLNGALNLTLLYHWQLGVVAVLLGNLITAAVSCGVLLVLFRYFRGGIRFDWSLIGPMTRFGLPLVVVALLASGIHQIGRFFLVGMASLDDIGTFSFVYTLGQGVNTMFLSSFSQIWSVVVYEIAALENPKRVFADVFEAFTRGLLLILLAASLGARFIVAMLAPPEYAPAADVIPIICLGYFFFSLDDHFRVPALIHKRTVTLIPVYLISVGVTVLLNVTLIPRFGIVGSAWATVGTFVAFAAAGLHWYRRVDRIDYPLGRTAGAVAIAIGTYAFYRLAFNDQGVPVRIAAGVLLWAVVAGVFLRGPLQMWRASRAAATR